MISDSPQLGQYLNKASGDLPAMPAIASQVMMSTQDPSASVDDLRHIIEQDPAIAAQILKASNSAIYGASGKVQHVGQAISMIGMRTIRNLVLGASMKQTAKRFGLMEKLLFEHSVCAGPLASKLAGLPQIEIDPEDAFTAGLLHDIGKTALANSDRDDYEQVVQRVYNEKISFVQAERDQFGFDHAQLGVAVAMNWNLPDLLVTVIGSHHDADALQKLPEADARLTALVMVTTSCLTRLGTGRRAPVPELDVAATPGWTFLGLGADDVENTLARAEAVVLAARVIVD